MTCQRCSNKASVHLTETVDGRRREQHLCASCAREAGLALPPEAPSFGLEKVVENLILANVGELVGELAAMRCPGCGLGFMQFRAEGRLGCPRDYDIFRKGLLPLIARVQGTTRHVGKVPRRQPKTSHDRLQIRSRLRTAIAQEDFELAARLRDELRQKDRDA